MHEPSLQRAYDMFLRCHHIVAVSASESELAREICRAAVDELGYRLAWIGVVDPGSTHVRPIGHAGFEDGYLDRIVVSASDDEYGRGPTGTAVREGRVAACRDIASEPSFAPWREDALARGYGASVAIPLVLGAHPLGALSLYATEPSAFDEREIALLEEVALDVALAIVALRSSTGASAAAAPPDDSARNELACAVAAAAAHDLSNMLAVVTLSLADLAKRLPERTNDAAFVDASAAVASAVELTRQVQVLSKRALAVRDAVDVDACIAGTRSLLVRIAGARAKVSLELRAGRARVSLGAIDLQRIVINLVLNATQAGGPRVQIVIETHVEEGFVVLRVRDDGPGIPADLVERVFEPSFTTKGSQGTGLGLASVARLVHEARGTIEVESDVAPGAVFAIRLPRVEPPSRDTSASG